MKPNFVLNNYKMVMPSRTCFDTALALVQFAEVSQAIYTAVNKEYGKLHVFCTMLGDQLHYRGAASLALQELTGNEAEERGKETRAQNRRNEEW